MSSNVFIIITALLLSSYGAVTAQQCGFPCQMSCYRDNPSDIKRGLGDSPLLAGILPDINYEQAVADAAAVLPATLGLFKGSQLKGAGLSWAVTDSVSVTPLNACAAMAVAPDKEYIALKFGFGKLPFTAAGKGGKEICVAVQVCDGSLLMGMRGFKVDVPTPLGTAGMGPTAFGLSVKGGLSETSRVPLWFGDAVAADKKTVMGHIQMAGFLQWSVGFPGVLVMNLRTDASMILNLQPDLSQPLVAPNFAGLAGATLQNMEVLLSAGLAPNIEVLNLVRINLGDFLGNAQASVYLSTLGEGSTFDVAIAFIATVRPFAALRALGLGDGFTTKVIEEVVDDFQISGALKFFVSHQDGQKASTKWGLRLEGDVSVKKSEVTGEMTETGANAISITGGSNDRTRITLTNRNNKTIFSISLCNSEENCKDDEYCDNVFKACRKKVGRGSLCVDDEVCSKGNTCVRGFCNRDCAEGCDNDEFCDSTFNVCNSKVGKGSICVEDKVCSGDLLCKLGFCNEGCRNDGECGQNQFCSRVTRACLDKFKRGQVCTQSFECKDECVRGFCNKRCSSGCNKNEFCDSTFKVCNSKVGKGSICLEDKVCSGDLLCKVGKCANGCKNDAGCRNTQFCDRVTRSCKSKFNRGRVCVKNFECKDECVRGFCNRRCSSGCSKNEFCDSTFKVCNSKVGKGSPCVESKVCKSGKCSFFFCR